MNYFNKISGVPTFTEMAINEAIDVYPFRLSSPDRKYPEYKFTVPETDTNRKYVYTVNLDGGFRGNPNDYEVTFYFGKDDGGDIYSRTNNLGLQHLYSVLATMDAILLDAAARFPVRDFIIVGESTESEKGNHEAAGVRTRMYLRYAERHYPAECWSYEEGTGIMRIHAYELPDSLYASQMDEHLTTEEGLCICESTRIPYNDYSDFRKIHLTSSEQEFNVELRMNGSEITIEMNPLPRSLQPFINQGQMDELFTEVKLMLTQMASSLGGGGDYPVTLVKVSSSAIPSDTVDPEVGKANRMIEHMTDDVLFHTGVTYTPEYKNGVFCAKCDTTVANLA